jgi:sugar/nucleoside kinase (ribokinase family)
VPDDLIRSAKVTYLEGYLWDPMRAKQAFRKAAQLAHEAGRKVSLTLSDSFCVERHRDDFLDLVAGHVDILFANEAEIHSLYQVKSFEEALKRVRGHCEVAALTRSEKGSVIVTKNGTDVIKAAPVPAVVDTTGAGDLYAAGFLFGYTRGLDVRRCGELASLAAAEVISHFGARPEIHLMSLL